MNRRRQSALRATLLAADPTCAYCGKPLGIRGVPRLDHVQPKSRGGSDGPHNRVLCCRGCDTRKADLTPAELLAWAQRVAAVAGSSDVFTPRPADAWRHGGYFPQSEQCDSNYY
ncbi:MAG: hypothetical protein EXS05_20640 [Planctomycetaceae bacterium]|nr:hypothetical protein [Planctomycetaceae bacterium]